MWPPASVPSKSMPTTIISNRQLTGGACVTSSPPRIHKMPLSGQPVSKLVAKFQYLINNLPDIVPWSISWWSPCNFRSDGVPCGVMSTDTTRLLILEDSMSSIQLINCGTYWGTIDAEQGTTAEGNWPGTCTYTWHCGIGSAWHWREYRGFWKRKMKKNYTTGRNGRA